jgi:hypothetical protein
MTELSKPLEHLPCLRDSAMFLPLETPREPCHSSTFRAVPQKFTV